MYIPESALLQGATLNEQDISVIQKCRGQSNRLGFCYQLVFVKVYNQFPKQTPFHSIPDIWCKNMN